MKTDPQTTDRLRMNYINSLPQPFLVRLCGGTMSDSVTTKSIHAVLSDPEDHLARLRLRKINDYYASIFGYSIDWAVQEIDRLRKELKNARI